MGLLWRCGWFAGLGVVALLAVLLALAGPAAAAFSGRDGLLAVQPLHGHGVVLVKANGHGWRRICANFSNECRLSGWRPARPQWSPDGRALLLDESQGTSNPYVQPASIYPDGSCLSCGLGYNDRTVDASFTNDPTQFTAVSQVVCTGCTGGTGAGLIEFGIDGVAKKVLLSGSMSDPVWSSGGQLAVVRRGWIWVGSPASLTRLAPGSDPSWSPDGSKIVFERKGWLLVRDLRARAARRLVQGSAPAWSPDGRWIAFFDRKRRLSVVRVGGGRVRRVLAHHASVTGYAVDWQPIPTTPSSPCQAPPGATVAASGDTATVTFDPPQTSDDGFGASDDGFGWSAMGCLHADGRYRVLASGTNPFIPSFSPSPTSAAVAGNYAAMVMTEDCGRYEESRWSASVALFDLRTGAEVPDRGGESAVAELYTSPQNYSSCQSSMDQLVVGSDAVGAVHTSVNKSSCTCTVEQIQASDSTGVHTLDSATEPQGSPTLLTKLALTGDTLTWEHNGSPRSAQLQP